MKKIIIFLVASVLVGISVAAYAASPELIDLWERISGVWVPCTYEVFDDNAFTSYEYAEDGREPVVFSGWFQSEGYRAEPKSIKALGKDKYIVDFFAEYNNEYDGGEGTTSEFYQEEFDLSDLDKGIIRIFFPGPGVGGDWKYYAASFEEAAAKWESQWQR